MYSHHCFFKHAGINGGCLFFFCRFEQTTKDDILGFLLDSAPRFSAYGKVGLLDMFIHAMFVFA